MSPRYLKISEFSRLINDTLEQFVGESFFEGELQEVTVSANGHLYCSIKDENSSLSIVMWASAVRSLKFKVEKGISVRCRGKPNLYSKTGRMQVVVSQMELAGEGLLAQRFEQLRKKLEAEGLFDKERKRPLPYLPKSIGIVSSAGGAAIHDIMIRLQSRMPQIPVYLIDVRVQGEGSVKEIAAALKYFSDTQLVDVIICGRGGGSLQDLWSFNEEEVVRAIFASKVPVISAVGHEVDITLSDLAADVRAPTPTAAAEMVVPNRSDLQRMLVDYERRLLDYSRWLMPKYQEFDELNARFGRAVQGKIENFRYQLEVLKSRVLGQSPQRILAGEQHKISLFENRLCQSVLQKISSGRGVLDRAESKLSIKSAFDSLSALSNQLKISEQKLKHAGQQQVSALAGRINLANGRLEALNPDKVLRRGYSVAMKNGKVVPSSRQLKSGEDLTVKFFDGAVETVIK